MRFLENASDEGEIEFESVLDSISSFSFPTELLTPPRPPSRLGFRFEDLDKDDSSDFLPAPWDMNDVFRKTPNTNHTEEEENSCVLYSTCVPSLRIDDQFHREFDFSAKSGFGFHNLPSQIRYKESGPILWDDIHNPVSMSRCITTQTDMSGPLPTRKSPQKSSYSYHGYSRSALNYTKLFWQLRHEEWAEWQAIQKPDASHKHPPFTSPDDGPIASCLLPPSLWTPRSGLDRDRMQCPPGGYSPDMNAPIYPRVGDISALRDPYSVNVDRSFLNFPLWTIQKMLYVYDMHQRFSPPRPNPFPHYFQYVPRDRRAKQPSGSPYQYIKESSQKDNIGVTDDPSTTDGCDGIRLWELSWYARWSLFIDLVRPHQWVASLNPTVSPPLSGLWPPVEIISRPSSPSPPVRVKKISSQDNEEECDESSDDED